MNDKTRRLTPTEATFKAHERREMAKGDLTREQRLQIMLTPEELEALDNFPLPTADAKPGGCGA